MNIIKTNLHVNHTILDHMDQCFNQLLARKSKFIFTYRYQGSVSDIAFVAESYKQAEDNLVKFLPGMIEILGCKEVSA